MHKDDTWKPASSDNYPLVRISGRDGWRKATSIDIIKNMPGTPYYFGRELNRKLDIAIGLRIAGQGGTSLWQWTPKEVHESKELLPFYKVLQSRMQYHKDGKLPKKGLYPPAKGFAPTRYPYFPQRQFFAVEGLVNMENWVSKTPSRGIVFWQGENDLGFGANYEIIFRKLIQRYQANAGREFPFYFIQLPTYEASATSKSKRAGLAALRDAQRRVAETEKNTHMIVSYDIYSRGIHPSKKQEFGTRLANAVLGHTYKKDVAWIHAKYDKIEIAGSTLKVHFKDTGKGLKTKDGKAPIAFTIAGEDGKFYPAEARIVGGKIIEVKSSKVSKPAAVRYAWSRVPNTNLVGDGDLPVSPFRSDNWELYPVK